MRIDGFLPYLMPSVQGCSEPFAERAILEAADRFCRQSRIWREAAEPIPVAAGQADYEIEIEDTNAALWDVVADLSGQRLSALPPDLQRRGAKNSPTRFYAIGREVGQDEEPAIRLVGAPSRPGELFLTLILRPTEQARDLPDFLFGEWHDGIVSGALARLCATPNQPFASAEMASHHADRFRIAVNEAAGRATLGNAKAGLRTRAVADWRNP